MTTVHELTTQKYTPESKRTTFKIRTTPRSSNTKPIVYAKAVFLSTLEQPSARRRGCPAHNRFRSPSFSSFSKSVCFCSVCHRSKIHPLTLEGTRSSAEHLPTTDLSSTSSIDSAIFLFHSSFQKKRKEMKFSLQLFNHCLCHGCLFTVAHGCYLRVPNIIRLPFVLRRLVSSRLGNRIRLLAFSFLLLFVL
ncbi:hypothetical protein AVEN_44841-1 [Araneus ventricosus]|uniref:Uncharacterized protein n=1 Tax=Araneus ventricosus TaxID=182803 RepID=A0A4Y2CN25_ARAVE|nr:hypothetical protein AVEN_44841-1 [Araneus ventricosus]